MRALWIVAAVLGATAAEAAQFSISLTNSGTNSNYPWSTGLLTLQPLIAIGPTPQPGSQAYASYSFANSQCDITDAFCSGTCNDNGNATVLAQRWGLTLGVNAWLVPALAANGGTATVTIDAPSGSRLSYLAWVANTSVFDDFVAIHPVGDSTTLSVPLFDGSGQPLPNVSFVIGGYDSNSTSLTDGSGTTCSPACPTATTGCYVAVGNASYGGAGSLPAPPTAPVANLTAVAGNLRNVLTWTNVAPHDGVLIVRRATAAPTWTPTNGTTYTVGARVHNNPGSYDTYAVYAEYGGTVSNTFTDTGAVQGIANGTRYYYKVFAHSNGRAYSTGNVPTTSGIFSEPTSKSGSSPLWCYSFGFPSLQRPTTESNAAIFTASNSGAVTANLTNPSNPALDGLERFRPVQLSGAVQARFPLLDLAGQAGKMIVTGDQSGRVYAISAQTGSVAWTANGGAQLGDAIQHFVMPTSGNGQPPWSHLLVGTRNGSTSNNKVYALSSSAGAVLWTYQPNDLDIISGGMVVHNGQVYVPARASGGTPSLRVLDVSTGAQTATLALGDTDFDVNKDANGLLYVTNNAGTVYGVEMATNTVRWSLSVGATSAPVFLTGNGFVASLKSGAVQRYTVTGTTVSQLWSTAITNPTGVIIYYPPSGTPKYYVGSSNGTVYQLNTQDGTIEKSLSVSASGVGMPTVDSAAGRLHVGTLDGRLCAYPVPFP